VLVRLRSLFVQPLVVLVILSLAPLGPTSVSAQTADSANAPSLYSAYSGTDAKPIPPAPVLGPANSVINDPTFGSRILRVTDQNTLGGASLIPTDAGFHRTWNANSTAIKLTNAHGQAYWLEFTPAAFTVGDGSSRPVLHPLSINYMWEWSAVDPDVIYFLNGNQLGRYNKATGVITSLGGPSNGDPVAYYAVVVGLDTWVCSAAGPGVQDTFTKIFCVDPSNTSNRKFIDVPNKTINGVVQSDPNWPTSASGQTIGIHSISGGAGASWLEITFHQQSWGGNGDAVLNLSTNTWSLLSGSDAHWSGHISVGNGRFVNGGGSIDGKDSRGAVVRDANALLDTSKMTFFMQPPTTVNWYDGEHSSWFNSTSNPNAPVLFSRYTNSIPSPWLTWIGEIMMAATDGSNTVWRFAHNHNGAWTAGYYTQAFAQVSNDGNWALFSSWWDGTLGVSSGGDFGVATRIDTFIVELAHPATSDTTRPSVTMTAPAGGSITSGTTVTVSASASDNVGVAGVQFLLDGAPLGTEVPAAPYSISWDTTLVSLGTHALAATARDAAGNRTTSSPTSVTLSLPTPSGPSISSVTTSSITSAGAAIGWTTDIPSDSQVDYGTTNFYGASTALNSLLLTAHSQPLGGLAAGTLYHYRVKSKDSLGNLSMSGDATFTTAAAPPPTSGDGPVGYWKLDDGSGTTALDASGSGYTGTLLNGPAWVPGVLSGALSFDGVNDSVDVPHTPAFDAYPLTIAAWFKTSATGLGGLINKYYPSSVNGYQIFTTGGKLCAWYFRDASDYIWDGSGCGLATSGFNDNRWHHVVFVVDASGGRLFVDGVQKAARAWTGTPGPTTTTQDLRFGQYPWTGPLFFSGALDDVRLYNRALASDEIAGLYGGGTPSVQNVAWTSLVNATATGNSLQKTSGCDGCQDAGAVSQQQIASGDGYFEFTATETDALRFAGLSNGNPGTSAAEIKYAIRLQSGSVDVRESGVYRASSTFVSGDIFRVAVESGVVKFYKNGALLYTSAVAPAYPLLVDTCLFNLNATVGNAVIKGAQ
jgi:Concanavalin A-like lectin/glucanases superfamily/Bacterial Ig domain